MSQNDLRKQNLEWLCLPSEQKSLLLTTFPANATPQVEEALPRLNAGSRRAGCHGINVCLKAGKLVTLCAWELPGQISRMEENLRQFFAGLEIRQPRFLRRDAEGIPMPLAD